MSRPAAIVTGGLRGIGRAVAETLAAGGFDIMVSDIRDEGEAELRQVVEARGARFALTVSDVAALDSHSGLVSATIDAFGRIDCLVNNAGIGAPSRGDLLDLSPENFDKVLGVNLRGAVFLTQAVAKAMLAAPFLGPRSIIAVTSVSAEMASPDRAEYCVSKAGLSMWTKNLALRLAESGIGVFEVRPGIISTDMTAAVKEKYDRLIAEGLVPAARWGTPQDVAETVAALAAGRLPFSTGSIIHCDGGLAVPRF